MNTKLILLLSVFAFTPIVVIPLNEWGSISAIGGANLQVLLQLYLLLFLVTGFLVLWMMVDAFDKKQRRLVFKLMVPVTFCFVSTFAGCYFSRDVRMMGMASFAERSQPLIAAIKQFEQNLGRPPKKLKDLVPTYLATVPDTGMSAYPEYRYTTGELAQKEYDGNPWVLTVFTPNYGLNFDQMLYFPKQNYPKIGYGGGLERVGDWAYVHE